MAAADGVMAAKRNPKQAMDFPPREILSTGSGNHKHQISRQEESYTADLPPRETPRTGSRTKRNHKQ